MKPKIFCYHMIWRCTGAGACGVGATVTQAYRAWTYNRQLVARSGREALHAV